MKALRLEAVNNLREIDLPLAQAASPDVVVRVQHCALCRTDLKMWQSGQRDLLLPRVLGHEIVGTHDGKQYAIWPGVACGNCHQCRSGVENLCPDMRIVGFHRDGGLAEEVLVPESSLLPLPKGLPPHLGCLAEPMGCGINSLDQAGVSPGQSVLIYGGGRVGILTAMAVLARGAKPFICEINEAKLSKAAPLLETLGVPSGTKPQGRSYDVALNAAPAVDTVLDGLQRLRPGGTFCLFSGLPALAKLPAAALNEIHYRQLRTVGAYGCTRAQMTVALQLLQKQAAAAEALVEQHIEIADVESALTTMAEGMSFTFVVTP